MKEILIGDEKKLEDFYMSDWKDIPRLLENIDRALEQHGLELIIGNNEDDNYWVKIEKR